MSISSHCIYNLQGYTYGYTFVAFGMLQMCSFNFDSCFISYSPLNFNSGIVFVIHLILSWLADLELEGICSILCSCQKKEHSVGLYWTPIIEVTVQLSCFFLVSMSIYVVCWPQISEPSSIYINVVEVLGRRAKQRRSLFQLANASFSIYQITLDLQDLSTAPCKKLQFMFF